MNQDKLVARINERRSKDLLGFEWHEYLPYVEPERLRPFLKPDADLSDLPKPIPVDRTALLAKMQDYMTFAFGKAHDHRGISAGRSLMHYVAWAWLAGDIDFAEEIDRMSNSDDYAPYGLPVLRRICEFYGWDPLEHGDEDYREEEP